MRGRIFGALAALLLTGAAAGASPLPGPLVSTEWLEAHRGEVLVIELQGGPANAPPGPTVAGASRVDMAKLRGQGSERGVTLASMPAPPEAFAAAMRAAGLRNGQSVVLTTRARTPEDTSQATYAYWELKYYGHDDVALLDGGTARWLAERRMAESEPAAPAPGDFEVKRTRPELLAGTQDVEHTLDARSGDVVDGRPFSFFVGLDRREIVTKAGHIPGATLFAYDANFRPDGTFRPKEELAKAATAVGLSAGRPVTAYCNTGQLSSVSWFVLSELLGYPSVKLYAGSMNAWTRLGLPVETKLR
ncbi:rhodanese-like domain-containing protein [Alsobacter sp. SYSU M60028]|uniref:Rhodanese-like domain-containing protein n=1 Tax=Alsobacter ponti TaxID=2962936 RepID=A0ABT1LHH7_9HYPH|nr:rhodanese-like domain-containing protein [Alsobacter ponti]MCP8940960.1 rhodanese-like domain-containing protein [Alsobacter ponti]